MAIYTVQEVSVTTVTSGKKPYNVAEVTYSTDRGENKTKKIMSFSNPGVFATVSKMAQGTRIEVENDGAPYYNWTSAKVVANEAPNAANAVPKSGVVQRSNFETPEERAARQVLIVRQSCLAQAVAFFSGIATELRPVHVNEVLDVAQTFTDWVFDAEGHESLGKVDRPEQDLSEE